MLLRSMGQGKLLGHHQRRLLNQPRLRHQAPHAAERHNLAAIQGTPTSWQRTRTQRTRIHFTNNTNFVPWWTTLLLLQATKATLGIKDSTRVDAMEDACDTMEQKCRPRKPLGAARVMQVEAHVRRPRRRKGQMSRGRGASFEHHMRCPSATPRPG